MPRDYAKPIKRTKNNKTGSHVSSQRWLGFLSIVIVFLLLGALLYWHQHRKKRSQIATQKTVMEAPPIEKPSPPIAPVIEAKPRFDFYKMLPDMTVNVGTPANAETTSKSSTNSRATTTSSIPAKKYILQIASFRSKAEAQALVDRLSDQHDDLHIASFRSANDVWYRVQAGPFIDRGKAERIQNQLRRIHIDSLLRQQ